MHLSIKDLRALSQFPTAKHQWNCLLAKISRGCQTYMLDFVGYYWFQTFWANVILSSSAITLATIIPHFSHHNNLLTGLPAPNLAFLSSVLRTAATVILLKSKTELASSLLRACTGFPFTQRMIRSPYSGLQSRFSNLLFSSSPLTFLLTQLQPHTTHNPTLVFAWSIVSHTLQRCMDCSLTFHVSIQLSPSQRGLPNYPI